MELTVDERAFARFKVPCVAFMDSVSQKNPSLEVGRFDVSLCSSLTKLLGKQYGLQLRNLVQESSSEMLAMYASYILYPVKFFWMSCPFHPKISEITMEICSDVVKSVDHEWTLADATEPSTSGTKKEKINVERISSSSIQWIELGGLILQHSQVAEEDSGGSQDNFDGMAKCVVVLADLLIFLSHHYPSWVKEKRKPPQDDQLMWLPLLSAICVSLLRVVSDRTLPMQVRCYCCRALCHLSPPNEDGDSSPAVWVQPILPGILSRLRKSAIQPSSVSARSELASCALSAVGYLLLQAAGIPNQKIPSPATDPKAWLQHLLQQGTIVAANSSPTTPPSSSTGWLESVADHLAGESKAWCQVLATWPISQAGERVRIAAQDYFHHLLLLSDMLPSSKVWSELTRDFIMQFWVRGMADPSVRVRAIAGRQVRNFVFSQSTGEQTQTVVHVSHVGHLLGGFERQLGELGPLLGNLLNQAVIVERLQCAQGYLSALYILERSLKTERKNSVHGTWMAVLDSLRASLPTWWQMFSRLYEVSSPAFTTDAVSEGESDAIAARNIRWTASSADDVLRVELAQVVRQVMRLVGVEACLSDILVTACDGVSEGVVRGGKHCSELYLLLRDVLWEVAPLDQSAEESTPPREAAVPIPPMQREMVGPISLAVWMTSRQKSKSATPATPAQGDEGQFVGPNNGTADWEACCPAPPPQLSSRAFQLLVNHLQAQEHLPTVDAPAPLIWRAALFFDVMICATPRTPSASLLPQQRHLMYPALAAVTSSHEMLRVYGRRFLGVLAGALQYPSLATMVHQRADLLADGVIRRIRWQRDEYAVVIEALHSLQGLVVLGGNALPHFILHDLCRTVLDVLNAIGYHWTDDLFEVLRAMLRCLVSALSNESKSPDLLSEGTKEKGQEKEREKEREKVQSRFPTLSALFGILSEVEGQSLDESEEPPPEEETIAEPADESQMAEPNLDVSELLEPDQWLVVLLERALTFVISDTRKDVRRLARLYSESLWYLKGEKYVSIVRPLLHKCWQALAPLIARMGEDPTLAFGVFLWSSTLIDTEGAFMASRVMESLFKRSIEFALPKRTLSRQALGAISLQQSGSVRHGSHQPEDIPQSPETRQLGWTVDLECQLESLKFLCHIVPYLNSHQALLVVPCMLEACVSAEARTQMDGEGAATVIWPLRECGQQLQALLLAQQGDAVWYALTCLVDPNCSLSPGLWHGYREGLLAPGVRAGTRQEDTLTPAARLLAQKILPQLC
mgnify:CR=1 FL=1